MRRFTFLPRASRKAWLGKYALPLYKLTHGDGSPVLERGGFFTDMLIAALFSQVLSWRKLCSAY